MASLPFRWGVTLRVASLSLTWVISQCLAPQALQFAFVSISEGPEVELLGGADESPLRPRPSCTPAGCGSHEPHVRLLAKAKLTLPCKALSLP
jgi:hypothetical protein